MQGINCKKKITGINHASLQGQRMALLINGMNCGEYEQCSKSKVLRKKYKTGAEQIRTFKNRKGCGQKGD